MYQMILLIVAAVLEVGGDALIRTGLKTGGVVLMMTGVAVLGGYGLLVNLTRLDFGRLMGIYIVLFFIIAQLVAVFIFRERPHSSVYAGGLLIVLGGAVMTVWQDQSR